MDVPPRAPRPGGSPPDAGDDEQGVFMPAFFLILGILAALLGTGVFLLAPNPTSELNGLLLLLMAVVALGFCAVLRALEARPGGPPA